MTIPSDHLDFRAPASPAAAPYCCRGRVERFAAPASAFILSLFDQGGRSLLQSLRASGLVRPACCPPLSLRRRYPVPSAPALHRGREVRGEVGEKRMTYCRAGFPKPACIPTSRRKGAAHPTRVLRGWHGNASPTERPAWFICRAPCCQCTEAWRAWDSPSHEASESVKPGLQNDLRQPPGEDRGRAASNSSAAAQRAASRPPAAAGCHRA